MDTKDRENRDDNIPEDPSSEHRKSREPKKTKEIREPIAHNHGWEDAHEQRMKLIGEKRAAFVWLYNETAKYYEWWNSAFALVVLVGSYLFGTSGIPVLFSSKDCDTVEGALKYVLLSLQICTIVIGVIATIQRFLKYERKIAKVRWASGKNASLYDDIKRELGRTRSRRQDYETFYDRVMKVEAQLRQEAPFIPKNIMQKYYHKMGKRAIPYDVLYNEESIVIRTTGTPTDDEIAQAKNLEKNNRIAARNEAKGRSREYGVTGIKPLDSIIKSLQDPPDYDLNAARQPGVPQQQVYDRVANRRRYELERYFMDE